MLHFRRGLTTAANSLPSIAEVRSALMQHVSAFDHSVSYDPNRSHPVSNSRTACTIPLGSNPKTQLRYKNASGYNRARFGVLLEDLDTFAVWCAFRHNQEPGVPMGTPAHHPMLIVTACVDRIEMQNKTVRSDLDILMSGHVSWVGRSSLEATMTLTQRYGDDDVRDLLTARFVMVSQDPNTGKSTQNTPLKLESSEDIATFERGEIAKNSRIARERNSLLRTVPTEEERNVLHEMFLKTINEKKHSFARILPAGHVWMPNAKLKNSIICFPEDQNLYGKIFGGYLMRVAFETAWANAAAFSHCRPHIVEVDNIMFRKSVEVGSLLLLNSQFLRLCTATSIPTMFPYNRQSASPISSFTRLRSVVGARLA
uniref:HotDog ACOT-type domain-containing protein n=1 Tax=Panagrellus redivivus TaxID=6233 RepID=A0A7E4VB63_PANRE